MNKTQITLRKADGYSEEMPTMVGLWLMVCGENSNCADYVAVTRSGGDDGFTLRAHYEGAGAIHLAHFHHGRTRAMWKRVA